MSIEAMKQALEALKKLYGVLTIEEIAPVDQAITSLRTAIEQAEKQEPHSWYSAEHDEWMTDKTRKEHERLNSYTHKVGGFDLPLYTTPPAAPVQDGNAFFKQFQTGLMDVQPAAPVQEPVAYIHNETGFLRKASAAKGGDFEPSDWHPLYTTPPAAQRQWVGLTDEERKELMQKHYARTEPLAFAIEAKLREKNGGQA